MNIAEITGITENIFNNLSWAVVDGEELHNIVEGLTILATEPINYPETDGELFYLRGKDTEDGGDIIVIIELGNDYNEEAEYPETDFVIKAAYYKPLPINQSEHN